MREMLELQEAIEYQRSRVDAMVEHGMDDEAFIMANQKLDQLIEEYIDLEVQMAYQEN